MRDAHLLKEKVQLSLDNRQIASLVVSALVILGMVFGLGVVVGRKMAPPPLPEISRSVDVLAEVDRKSKDPGLDPKELTYPEVLTKPAEPAKPAEPPAASRTLPRLEAPEPPAEVAEVTEPSPTKPPESKKPVLPAGAFSIQVSASQDKAEADGVAQRLRSVGYSPYILNADIPGKGRWYRVRLGHFGAKEDAERYLRDFKRETRLDAIVTAGR